MAHSVSFHTSGSQGHSRTNRAVTNLHLLKKQTPKRVACNSSWRLRLPSTPALENYPRMARSQQARNLSAWSSEQIVHSVACKAGRRHLRYSAGENKRYFMADI